VVSGVCVAIALVTGLSGWVFSGSTATPTHAQTTPPREGVSKSSEVFSRWLKQPLGEASVASAAEMRPPADSGPEVVTVQVAPAAQVTDAALVVAQPAAVEQRSALATPKLSAGDRSMVSVSFYYCEEARGAAASGDGGGFCGIVRDGSRVRSGVAACDVAYLGQRFQIEGDPTGRSYVCADTGSAVHGLHRDIWFLDNRDGWNWQLSVGAHAVIRVLP
jgi:3D (Asp-Asp-Asp) domain-containing protein